MPTSVTLKTPITGDYTQPTGLYVKISQTSLPSIILVLRSLVVKLVNCQILTLLSISRFINNEWVEGVDKKTFEVVNPATEEVICSVSEATEKDVDVAVKAARAAFEGVWKQTTPQERSIMLLKLADLAEKNLELLAAVESLDNGKSISMARGDVGAVVGCIRYYGGWADKIEGKTIDIAPDMFHYTRQEPVGDYIKCDDTLGFLEY